MIFIVVKFETRQDWTRRWPGLGRAVHRRHPGRTRQPVVRPGPTSGWISHEQEKVGENP